MRTTYRSGGRDYRTPACATIEVSTETGLMTTSLEYWEDELLEEEEEEDGQ